MKATHAIVVKIPETVKFEHKKDAAKVDLSQARRQQQELNETLKEAGVELIEISIDNDAAISTLFVDDVAVALNGTALILHSKKPNAIAAKVRTILQDLTWNIVDAPSQEHGRPVIIEGSDIFYTGREIFVGIRKGGTNVEGALVVARIFADIPVIPIQISGNFPLKYYVSLAADDILTVSKSKESQNILRRIERDATYRYKTVTVDVDESVNCINVNGRLIFRPDSGGTKFVVLQQAVELWGVSTTELSKIGALLTRFVLLVERLKLDKHV